MSRVSEPIQQFNSSTVQRFNSESANQRIHNKVGITRPKYLFFFAWMFVIPAAIAYFGGWDTTLNYLFFLKAFAIAFFSTAAYYLIEKQLAEKKKP